MIEIYILWKIAQALSRIAAQKNRSKSWALLGIGLWLGGEAAVFAVWPASTMGANWALSLMGAAAGAALAFAIVRRLDRLPGPDDPIPAAKIVRR